MGLTSNLAEVRRLFPDARRNVLYTPMDLANKPDGQVREDLERIARELGPCDVGFPDIGPEVPGERFCFVMDLCAEFSARLSGRR